MLAQKSDRFVVGTRFKISKLGALRCPDLTNKTGTVIEVSLRTTGITVLFDGCARPTCLHQDYLTPAQPSLDADKKASPQLRRLNASAYRPRM
ncbi:hypothetical protein [Bradyrhizobium sp. P5_C12]